jgi:hypothetical protein
MVVWGNDMTTRRLLLLSGLALAATGRTAAAQSPARSPATPTALQLSAPRAVHSIAALPDGSALFFGGCVGNSCDTGPASSTVDRYDPKTRTIKEIGRLVLPRVGGSAALLPDGGVLLAGGWVGGSPTASLERYDVARRTSERLGDISAAQICQAVALANGRVLIIGEATIEVFDPAARRISKLSDTSPFLDSATITLLPDGRVLIAGGGVKQPPRADAFLIDPATGRATSTGALSAPRVKHAAVRLLDGTVLIVGGSDVRGRNGGKMKAMELYDPKTGRFSIVGTLNDARYKIADAAVCLSDGRVLVAGGAEKPEIVDPRTWTSRTVEVPIGQTLNFAAAVALPNGDALVAGGYGERNIRPTDHAWLIPRAAMA